MLMMLGFTTLCSTPFNLPIPNSTLPRLHYFPYMTIFLMPSPSSFHLVRHFLCFTTMIHFISLIPHISCREPSTQFPFIPYYLRSFTRLRSRPSSFQSLYIPLSSLISASSICHLLYADDTQLFMYFVPKNFSCAINNLQFTINLISSWMSSNYLTLNPSKTEFLLSGLPQQTFKIVNPSLSSPYHQTHNAQPVYQKSRFHIWFDTVFLQTDFIPPQRLSLPYSRSSPHPTHSRFHHRYHNSHCPLLLLLQAF